MTRDVAAHIREAAEERILVLDGAWGVLLQSSGLSEQDFRGERFAEHPRDLLNNPDVLNLTRPDVVRAVHESYFAAGADIATTNTFTATSIGQSDYGLEAAVYDMNVAGAQIARQVAGDRLVAGSVGPLNITLSLSPRVDDP
ncbi:MAG TPA: homocysteine S-methyltransferase family protein, partial [Gaiellaceae bacterium]|nr:homocysteine S-methyltransferase family protein [Gaiellaceae bacterium]